MVPTFVTSDTHFNHLRIREICPWRAEWSADIEAHDRALIDAWRAAVPADSVVLHLGDFSFGDAARTTEIIRALPVRLVVVLGNHDRSASWLVRCGAARAVNKLTMEIEGRVVHCRHDPKRFATDPETSWADILLHGHWHGDKHRVEALPPEVDARRVDCGVDALRSLAPVPIGAAMALSGSQGRSY